MSNEPFDLAVSPPVSYFKVKPGERYVHTVTIEQQGQSPVTISPSLVDFAPAESGQGVTLSSTSEFPYLQSLTQAPFTLQPGEKRQVQLVFEIPSGAAEKEYHLTLLLSGQTDSALHLGTTGTQVNGILASNMVVLVSNQTADQGQLRIKDVTLPSWVDSLNRLSFQVLAENTGPHATIASGSGTLTNWRGQVVHTFTFYPDTVLAENVRMLRVSLPADSSQETTSPDGSPLPAIPQAQTDFMYDAPFLFGPYTLHLELQPNTQTQPLPPPGTFDQVVLAVPASLFLTLLLTSISYLLYRFLTRKLRRKVNIGNPPKIN